MTKARTLADNFAADINQVDASAPLTGGGTSGTVTVGIQDGTTTQKGAVQLEDSTASTSTTTAATPNSVKSAYDLADGAIAKTLVDAKADLITATGADTPARLAVGSNGDTLVADSAATTGLRWQGSYEAGKNVLINADFRINQRGFSSTTTNATYGFDRWTIADNTTITYSAQTFTPGTAPVAGYEGINFARMAVTTDSSAGEFAILQQKIEDVRTLAGQTVTVSFWAKASTGTPKVGVELWQTFGSGGSSSTGAAGQSVTISSSWARYSVTISNPSVSGKTINAGSYLETNLWVTGGSNFNTRSGTVGNQTATIDFWGVQVEAGSVATAFQTATGTLQGELAACQRYYQIAGDTIYEIMDGGYMASGDVAYQSWIYAVPMRTTPTGTVVGTWAVSGVGQPTLQATQQRGFCLRATANATGAYYFHSNTTYYLTFSAEL